MQYRKLIFAAALVSTVASTAVLASPLRGPGGPGGPGLADTNSDGVVTVKELEARQAQRFHDADTNGDGKIDVGEMQAAMLRARAQRRIDALDTNGDGTVSIEEFEAPMRWHLSRLDRNDDGRIDRTEMRPGHGRRWDDDHDRHGPRHERFRDDD
ncbi:MAG TPA: EF-hand domain-containing protein [Gammaproteobacteria bacterium]|nr:EF-hand domain-containing protein [Gammaproteobacteria bacterium]